MNLLRKFHLHSKVLWVMTLRYARFMLLFYPKRQLEFGIISLSFIFFRTKLIGTNPIIKLATTVLLIKYFLLGNVLQTVLTAALGTLVSFLTSHLIGRWNNKWRKRP